MTVSDLIDYLNQFPGETTVVLTTQDANELPDDRDFVVLESVFGEVEA